MHVVEEKDAISKMITLFEEFDARQQKLQSNVRVESQVRLASVSRFTMFKPAPSVDVATNTQTLTTPTKKPTQENNPLGN